MEQKLVEETDLEDNLKTSEDVYEVSVNLPVIKYKIQLFSFSLQSFLQKLNFLINDKTAIIWFVCKEACC